MESLALPAGVTTRGQWNMGRSCAPDSEFTGVSVFHNSDHCDAFETKSRATVVWRPRSAGDTGLRFLTWRKSCTAI